MSDQKAKGPIEYPERVSRWDPATHIRVGKTHILVNPNENTLPWAQELKHRRQHPVHIFITDTYAIDQHLSEVVRELQGMRCGAWDRCKVIIHIPRQVEDLFELARARLDRIHMSVITDPIILCESEGPAFRIPGPERNLLQVIYTDEGIEFHEILGSIPYANYKRCFIDGMKNAGPINTIPVLMHPELFRDKILQGFKEKCPEGILKAFKDDDDLWQFITEHSDVTVKVDASSVYGKTGQEPPGMAEKLFDKLVVKEDKV